MARVSVPRDRIADGSLPSVCAVCGAAAPHRRYPGVAAPSLAWLLVSPMLGLLAFWAYALVAGRSADGGGLPFCDRHRGYWRRRGAVVVGGFVVLVALTVVGAALSRPGKTHDLFGVAACWALLFLPAFLVVHLAALRPTGGGWGTLVLSRADREFAVAVEEQDADA